MDNGKAPKIGGNETVDLHAVRPRYPDNVFSVVVGNHERQRPDMRARFALACIERWGMVAAVPDGEDSAGRSKMRRCGVDEVVQFACLSAEAAFNQFQKRGWLIDIPSLDEVRDALQDNENAND